MVLVGACVNVVDFLIGYFVGLVVCMLLGGPV